MATMIQEHPPATEIIAEQEVVKVIDRVPGKVIALPTVDASTMTEEEFRTHFLDRHQPVLIKGSASAWAALQHWGTPGYLESRCMDEQVRISDTFNPEPADAYYRFTAKKGKLSEGLEEMRCADEQATRSIPAIRLPARWADDLGPYAYLSQELNRSPRFYPRDRLFIYKNASTDWHYHSFDETITTQLVGAKRISLFRLTLENWWPNSFLIESNLHHTSCGKRFFPEGDDKIVTKYEGLIEAGDAVYIPPFWWHGVDAADSAMGITLAHCFGSPIKRLADLKDPIVRRIVKRVAANRKKELPFILFMIARSTFSRWRAGEKW